MESQGSAEKRSQALWDGRYSSLNVECSTGPLFMAQSLGTFVQWVCGELTVEPHC